MLMLSHIFGQARQWLRLAAIALLGFGITLPALAQIRVTSSDKVIFPAGLKWERMRTVVLDQTPASKESPRVAVQPEDVKSVRRIWSDEVAVATAKGEAPHFNSQIITTTYKGKPIAFSLIDLPLDFDRCEQALNGKDVVDVYSKCLARVAIGSMPNPHVVEFSGFCYADSIWATPEELRFRAKTQNQVAFDSQTGTAYFRLLQHGKFVPACNRMIKIEGL